VPPNHPLAAMGQWFNPRSIVYNVLYGLIIVFFTYFYTAVVLNPTTWRRTSGSTAASSRHRRARKTAEYIDRVLSRITLPGAIFLAIIASLPDSDHSLGHAVPEFGGTSVLIVVGARSTRCSRSSRTC
jgi:preprotein translocase subunit SecY